MVFTLCDYSLPGAVCVLSYHMTHDQFETEPPEGTKRNPNKDHLKIEFFLLMQSTLLVIYFYNCHKMQFVTNLDNYQLCCKYAPSGYRKGIPNEVNLDISSTRKMGKMLSGQL